MGLWPEAARVPVGLRQRISAGSQVHRVQSTALADGVRRVQPGVPLEKLGSQIRRLSDLAPELS
jgi:hypothetical protein